MNFSEFKFDPRIAAGVAAHGYVTPTPIQEQAIPPVMAGRDVLGLAQTGTGKTAAFVLPILQRLVGWQGRTPVVRALIIAPTRELAEQINREIQTLGEKSGLRSTAIYGGVGRQPQNLALKRGVDIVVACPGRLLDHIGESTIDLSHVEVLVLDEADQMFDMGFLPDVRRILRVLPPQRQNLLFSATMPEDIRKLAEDVLRDPVRVRVSNSEPVSTVAHALYPVAQHLKTPLLMSLLDKTDTDSVLVFTRTKHRAKRVGEQLQKAGYRSTSLQGNLAQGRRQEALDGFRDGSYQILVATDIAARGLDISSVSHVINYDMPSTPQIYTHRIGRTGRAAKTGDAFTMVTQEDNAMVREIERLLGAPVERRTVNGFDYTASSPAGPGEFAREPKQPRPTRSPKATDAASGEAKPHKSKPAQPQQQATEAQPRKQKPAPQQAGEGQPRKAKPAQPQQASSEPRPIRPPRPAQPQPQRQSVRPAAANGAQQAAPASGDAARSTSSRRRRRPRRNPQPGEQLRKQNSPA